jgi:DNA-binding NarL/FixJ family response regulator
MPSALSSYVVRKRTFQVWIDGIRSPTRPNRLQLPIDVSHWLMHLSPRQRQILTLIAEGMSDKEIACRLGVSARTVDSHLQRLYQRHDVHTRAALVARWLRDEAALHPVEPVGEIPYGDSPELTRGRRGD